VASYPGIGFFRPQRVEYDYKKSTLSDVFQGVGPLYFPHEGKICFLNKACVEANLVLLGGDHEGIGKAFVV